MSIEQAELTGQSQQHIHWLTEAIGIHQAMYEPWQALCGAALADGIDIKIASGFRDFERQLKIWQNKFNGKTPVKDLQGNTLALDTFKPEQKVAAILLFSALPGASRHHWGCDIDIYGANLLPKEQKLMLEPWEYQENGPFYPLTKWLIQHARQFDFYFPYDKFRGGVAAEPWHISYLPLARDYQQAYTIELLAQTLTNSNILGKKYLLENLPDIYQNFIINVAHEEVIK